MAQIVDFALRHPDLMLCGALTLLAAVVRLYALGDIPAGVHGDEAQVGLDARRVLAHGWIGPYTLSALGQPSGHAYLTAPAIWLFGSTAWSLRLPLALTGIGAIPLAYLLFYMLTNRVQASIAAFLLATSLWHIHFSRVAHWPISYGTVGLGVLVLWTLAVRSGRWYWFAAAGALVGLGLYTYNVYPVFVVAFAVWVAAYTLLHRRGALFLPWARNVALAAAISLVAGLPLFLYIADADNHYFDHYHQYYRDYSVLQSPAFKDGGLAKKADIIGDQAYKFLGAYAWRGVTDAVDGAAPDGRPVLDVATVLLLLAGLAYAAMRWRQSPYLMVLCLVLLIPLPAMLQTNATYRGALGVAPFICFLAALPLSHVWRESHALSPQLRLSLRGATCALLLLIAYVNLHAYFGVWAKSEPFSSVYAESLADAVHYVDGLPGHPYVYFLSQAISIEGHDTPHYLAPHLAAEDRSSEFNLVRDLTIDRGRDSVFVLKDVYAEDETLAELKDLYPGGSVYERDYRGKPGFIVYSVPAIGVQPPGR